MPYIVQPEKFDATFIYNSSMGNIQLHTVHSFVIVFIQYNGGEKKPNLKDFP